MSKESTPLNSFDEVVTELQADALIAVVPDVSIQAKEAMMIEARDFSLSAPNDSARRVRLKLAVHHMIKDCQYFQGLSAKASSACLK